MYIYIFVIFVYIYIYIHIPSGNYFLRKLIFANFANFGRFRENFFREKSKIDQFVKISSREISTFPLFAKIRSVLKFAKNAIFWLFFIPRFYKGRLSLHNKRV